MGKKTKQNAKVTVENTFKNPYKSINNNQPIKNNHSAHTKKHKCSMKI